MTTNLTVSNQSGVTVYLGGDDVTTGNGYPLGDGGSIFLALEPLDVLYAVVSTGSVNLKIFTQAH